MSQYKYDFSGVATHEEEVEEYPSWINESYLDRDAESPRWNDILQEELTEETASSSSRRAVQLCQWFRQGIQLAWIFLRPSGRLGEDSSVSSKSTGMYRYQDTEETLAELYLELRKFFLIILCVSLFFWSWAVHNTRTMTQGQDLGIFSFGSTFATSLWILYRTKEGPLMTKIKRKSTGNDPKRPRRVASLPTRVLVTASHVLVALNYALGALFAFTVSNNGNVYVKFATYCIIFICLWSGAAIMSFSLLKRLSEVEADIFQSSLLEHDDDPLY